MRIPFTDYELAPVCTCSSPKPLQVVLMETRDVLAASGPYDSATWRPAMKQATAEWTRASRNDQSSRECKRHGYHERVVFSFGTLLGTDSKPRRFKVDEVRSALRSLIG